MKQHQILVIEDDRDMAYQLKLRLEAKGYAVETVQSGSEGLARAREYKPDAIVMDVMLPELDGYRICRLLKFDTEYEHIPIIVVTARTLEEDRDMALEVGADAYLTKPVDWKALYSTLENFLAPQAEEPETVAKS
ncbi:MAG: response regulator [candidate division KSB1 bacterium]|nr:response regulator [candidate division KSB1 bacterium]